MMKWIAVAGMTALALTGTMAGAAATRAPRVSIASLEQLPQPLPLPYDVNADADRQVAAARARAKASGKRLIIDLGGNWCADCRILAGVMELPELRAFLRRHYEIVTVDVGRFDRNQQIIRHYGLDRLQGVPALLIVDPRSDKLLNRDRLSALADARHMTPQALADWLAQWI
ncbi:thiol-disulfide isomerase/thioredoxin [Sphingobium scionense]|uniref:Thiol-disulfide isomerase/thioredoxin n=2 Tax=Sphingobium scionense TaxID=1404341 RepID=A0A7W6LQ57_9SPHN|nr:thiol-disulfide isomerase/thioredoxin [Sphingobium scionense]